MRACRHCSHQNADHLSYCSQCGHRLVSSFYPTLGAGASPTGRGLSASTTGRNLGLTAALSPTMVSTPRGTITGPGEPLAALRAIREMIGILVGAMPARVHDGGQCSPSVLPNFL